MSKINNNSKNQNILNVRQLADDMSPIDTQRHTAKLFITLPKKDMLFDNYDNSMERHLNSPTTKMYPIDKNGEIDHVRFATMSSEIQNTPPGTPNTPNMYTPVGSADTPCRINISPPMVDTPRPYKLDLSYETDNLYTTNNSNLDLFFCDELSIESPRTPID